MSEYLNYIMCILIKECKGLIMKVLICDDSILIRKKLTEALEEHGVNTIVEAKDGENSIEMYKKHSPDLVFMDIVMPKKNGLEAIGEIVSHDSKANVVVLSSVGTKENLQEALKIGAKDFIQKPWTNKNLEKVLGNFK